jgi:hypothetical protein
MKGLSFALRKSLARLHLERTTNRISEEHILLGGDESYEGGAALQRMNCYFCLRPRRCQPPPL